MASKKDGVLYIGVTSDIIKRVFEHKNGVIEDSFTDKYFVKKLVFFEVHNDVEEAILKEKRIKKWNREWKVNLIEKNNPNWEDMYEKITL
jgi:putative endonuclease